MSARIPRATYRLQLHRGFTFRQAAAIVPYLKRLGISDVYCSPIFEAPPESTHGYNVWDHSRINSTLGGPEEWAAFASELSKNGLGLLLDFVPNHMGIEGEGNRYWADLLEHGPSSKFARFFDVHWDRRQKVILPVLGDFYGAVLERGELKIVFQDGKFWVAYFNRLFPLNPETAREILDEAVEALDAPLKSQVARRLQQPPSPTSEVEPLEAMASDFPALKEAIEGNLSQLNGEAGDPASFNPLDRILDRQHYRFMHWAYGRQILNYRRFFEIDTLVGLRIEDPEVFQSIHALLRSLIAARQVTGLRIDHIDGLYDPEEYLKRLQDLAGSASGSPDRAEDKPFYVVVEKILEPSERLPETWPVHGTSGYEFASQVTALLVNGASAATMTEIYNRFTGTKIDYEALVLEKKRLLLATAFPSEWERLTDALHGLAQADRKWRDLTKAVLKPVLGAFICSLPVYRTNLGRPAPPSAQDRAIVLKTKAAAKSGLNDLEIPGLEFLTAVLLGDWPSPADTELAGQADAFVRRLQQKTGALMAKSVEDTAFYLYNRLNALNEVGSSPLLFGESPDSFHRQNEVRLESYPGNLLATSTHDTKLSEDVRARLAALSEIPAQWEAALERWSEMNRPLKAEVDGRSAPDPNEEYLLYQVLLGTWPFTPDEDFPDKDYVDRIQAYLRKATREAKTNSSWIKPNSAWEEAQSRFIETILRRNPKTENAFLRDFHSFSEQLARLGSVNSLAQTLLKLTVPGVPDFYQGNEIWDLSLVDPDNRRPVDYSLRAELLDSLSGARPKELLENWRNGALKMFLIRQVLELRARSRELFEKGAYLRIEPTGPFSSNCLAFERRWGRERIVVLAPRLSAQIGFPPTGKAWKRTEILVEAGDSDLWRDLFTGATVPSTGRGFLLADAFAQLPFALLHRQA